MSKNIQLENGFTRIANELLEVIYSTNFNSTQLRIILCIIRYTYGFNRKNCEISLSFLSKAIGVSKRYISAELNKLIDAKVISVIEKYSVTASRVLAINKNYSQWIGYRTILLQANNTSTGDEYFNTPVDELFNTPVDELFNTTVEELFNTPVEQLFYQERQYKDKYKDNIYSTHPQSNNTSAGDGLEEDIKSENNQVEIYKTIIEYLNQKCNTNYKYSSAKTKSLIDARMNEGFSIEDFRRVIDVKAAEWLNNSKMSKYLRPETLLSNKFEGYLNQKGGENVGKFGDTIQFTPPRQNEPDSRGPIKFEPGEEPF